MITFTLKEEQVKKAREWMAEREKYSGAIGGQFSYIFTPTSLGDIIEITDGKETLDLTDLSDW